MANVLNFEELDAWRKARLLTKAVYEETRQGAWCRDFGLAGQIQRASVSIMSNIAEGSERGTLNDYHRFLTMAKASCAEVRSQLYVALDVGYLDTPSFQRLLCLAEEVARLIGGLRASIARKRDEMRQV